MAQRIPHTFGELRKKGKKALIPYITPEFPVKGTTVPLLRQLASSGADMIEVGVPFSDPLADGKTIQHSSEVALTNGVTFAVILNAVREFRRSSEVPVLLMGYMNPILRRGIENFLREAKEAGVDGLIIPDLPPEEAAALKKESERVGISNVFLIAPTTDSERMRTIDGWSTDFSYCVSITGVTGARAQLGANGSLDRFLKRVRENTKKPFVVGFGISNAEQVSRVWSFADGAVVGSALIDVLARASGIDDAVKAAGRFLTSLRPS